MDNPSVLDYPKYMVLTPKILKPVLDALDQKLEQLNDTRELIVCGGAALLILNVIDRQTRDVDVVTPPLDSVLRQAAEEVRKQFGLEPNWLNNGPESLARDLELGWESRASQIYKGKFLTIKSLARRDLIASKLYAMCDRDESDLDDLVQLKPSFAEIETLREWVLERDASELWPARVEKCLKRLKARLGHE